MGAISIRIVITRQRVLLNVVRSVSGSGSTVEVVVDIAGTVVVEVEVVVVVEVVVLVIVVVAVVAVVLVVVVMVEAVVRELVV